MYLKLCAPFAELPALAIHVHICVQCRLKEGVGKGTRTEQETYARGNGIHTSLHTLIWSPRGSLRHQQFKQNVKALFQNHSPGSALVDAQERGPLRTLRHTACHEGPQNWAHMGAHRSACAMLLQSVREPAAQDPAALSNPTSSW